ncbi:hypothetical protein GCM10010170_095640 [Dactylosporangium salmoneum]|uniref:YtxH domain-containing protein n=2 Tax=Dactylosporangium salmoneum TaxID=53361 RepID=A0ABN3HRW6_9ACTN
MTLAAGVAVGYVLGTRAGRAKYEQIVDGVRQVRANPTLDQVQRTVREVATAPRQQTAPVGPAAEPSRAPSV